MLAIDAWSRATCDSSAIVTLSRKRRCTRVLTVRRNQVAVAETPRPMAAARTRPGRPSSTPLPSSMSHSASSASGNAASCDNANAASIRLGSWRYPSLHSRHIDRSAGGNGAMPAAVVRAASPRCSTEDVIGSSFLVLGCAETLCLQIEHRPVAAALGHELVVRPEFDDAAFFEHADTIGMPYRGHTVRAEA